MSFLLFYPSFTPAFFNKWFTGDKGSLSRQPERTLAAGQGDGWPGDIQLGRTGCVFVWRMTVWTPNNCPLASADLLSEVYFGKSHFLPLYKGCRPHLGKCDFDETFISGTANRMKGGEHGGGTWVGRPPSSTVNSRRGWQWHWRGVDLWPSEELLQMPPTLLLFLPRQQPLQLMITFEIDSSIDDFLQSHQIIIQKGEKILQKRMLPKNV